MVLTAGVITLISSGSNSATLSTTSASGGTGPYTQQWYRDTSGAGFTPSIGNIIHNATGLILTGAGLVPNTQYFYKVVYTDATMATVESAAFVVTTLPASQGMNQFSMAAILGQLDLQSGPKNVVAAQVDVSQLTPLYPGQPIKFVNNPYGIPTVVAAGIDMPNGYIVYDQKSPSFPAGARCELARTQTCIWLYATTVIERGKLVILDPDVASGVQQASGISELPIIGEAFDSATAEGQLIRIILNVPSNVIDIAVIVSNILEIDGPTIENLATLHLLRSIINGVPSNEVAVQIPIPSPVENNLVSMDDAGNVKDSGVAVTTDSMSNDNSHLPTTEAMQSAIIAGVVAGYAYQGPYDASSGVYPSVNKFGGPIDGGDFWRITVGGTLPGPKIVYVDDEILSLIDVPGQTPSNWAVRSGKVVIKFNGRDGLVDPESDDYSLEQITGLVAALALKADLTYVDAQLALKASLTYVDAQLALKSDLTYVDAQLALKASLIQLALKADITYVDAQLALKASLTYVDAQLALKASLTQLALKADITYVDAQIATREPTITNLPANKGGTGNTSYTIGDLLYASTTTALSKLAAPADGSILRGNGAGVAPSWDANLIKSNFQKSTANTLLTAQTEVLVAVAPLQNANGNYILSITEPSNSKQLTIFFQLVANKYNIGYPNNSGSPLAVPSINVLEVNDTSRVITPANISQYLTFVARYRISTPNAYAAVTVKMSGGLLYSSPTLTFTITQCSESFLQDNTTITQYVSQKYSVLDAVAPSVSYGLINVTYVSPVTTYGANLFAYCCVFGGTTLNMYTINTSNGILSNNSPSTFTVGTAPRSLIATKDARYLYAANNTSGNIQMMILDVATGILSNNSPSTISAGSNPSYMAIYPAYQNYLYVTNSGGSSNINAYSIDRATGLLTALSTPSYSVGAGPIGIAITPAVSPATAFLYVANSTANSLSSFSINPASGLLTSLGAATGLVGAYFIVMHPNGNFMFITQVATGQVYTLTINTSTGATATSGTVSTGTNPYEAAITPNGNFLYVANNGSNTVGMYSVNSSTGVLTALSPATVAVSNPTSLKVSNNGLYLYVTSGTAFNTVSMFSINQSTGQLTALSTPTIAAGTNPYGLFIV